MIFSNYLGKVILLSFNEKYRILIRNGLEMAKEKSSLLCM